MLKLTSIINEDLLETDIEHTVGNSLFALETNLLCLEKRVAIGKTEEALSIIQEMKVSVEKAKSGLFKWKNRQQ